MDGNYTNFFHTDWHDAGTVPHYIDITLPSPVEQFKIQTYYRNGKYGQCPVEITVLGSNDGEQWNKIAEIEDDGKGGASYTTPTLGTEGCQHTLNKHSIAKDTGILIHTFACDRMSIVYLYIEQVGIDGNFPFQQHSSFKRRCCQIANSRR